ncbi:MAG: choice-of-anchor V domain-containing protein [Bryobacteraceae bacterium]
MSIRSSLSKLALGAALAALPSTLLAFSAGPPALRAGVPSDATGTTCTACHRTFDLNSGAGKLTVFARPYKPGVKQTIRVLLQDPQASKWGFELTARFVSDETKQAGTFTPTDAIRVVCAAGTPAPCAGTTEFATHNLTSNFAGQRTSNMWEIEWTPPMDGGEVIFYAAGNAANNNSNNQGDYIYNTNVKVAAESCNLTGTPRISAIRNGASFDDRSIGMNSIITLGGTGFQAAGQNRTAGLEDFENSSFPKELACMAVEVGTTRAPVLFVNPTQINAQVPSLTAFGNTPVRVVLNPGTSREIKSDPVNIPLTEYSPGFFRLLPTPCIAAVNVADGSLSGDPDLFPNVRPSKVGEIVALYATGLGQLEPFYQSGEIIPGAAKAKFDVKLTWEGVTMSAADVLYIGSTAGGISGLYQINIRVPANAKVGQNNQVRIVTPDGRTSADNTVLFIK